MQPLHSRDQLSAEEALGLRDDTGEDTIGLTTSSKWASSTSKLLAKSDVAAETHE